MYWMVLFCQNRIPKNKKAFIAKTWKLSKCPLIDKWLKKMWYTHTHTHTMEYYSAIKMKQYHLQQHGWI